MPQQSLLPEHPAMTGFTFEIRSYPDTPFPDQVNVLVRVGSGCKPPSAIWTTLLTGLERDYLDTLVEAATSAYMYGETARDVARACADVHRLARQHARAHEF